MFSDWFIFKFDLKSILLQILYLMFIKYLSKIKLEDFQKQLFQSYLIYTGFKILDYINML